MYIGKLVNTHGIKGEIKIQSDIDHKDAVFKIGNEISIASKAFKIKTYRVHKGYDMVTFDGINNINDILPLKGNKVFIDRNLLPKDIIFYDDDIISEDDLIVPHPDMKNRDFVLKPLMQIAPYKLHPVYRKTISDMYVELMAKKQ